MTGKTLRKRIFGLTLAISACLATSARAQVSLEGNWDTPLGAVRIEQNGDEYVGKLADNARACPFAKGSEVLRGRIVDGMFTGEVKVCYPPRCKLRDHWLLAMAIPADDGARLVGAGAPVNLYCPNNVLLGLPFSFSRQSPSQPAAELAPPVDDAPRRKMKPEAQKLYREGVELSGVGRYEAARTKLLLANQKDPKNPEILNLVGITFYARNDYPMAEKYYRNALAAEPRFNDSRYNLACVLARQGRVREALRELRTAVDNGFASVSAMDNDRDLDPLRSDVAFREIRSLAERNAARSGH